MSEINYPPSRTVAFGDALKRIEEGDADYANADADAERIANGLEWAIDEWGEGASVTLQALTTGDRARVKDTIAGDPGEAQIENMVLGQGLQDAPWLDGDEDLPRRIELVSSLPPGLGDWLKAELFDLMELNAGN